MDTKLLLSLQNITLSHGDHVLLDNVSLTMNAGEHVCLIGRNGVGKSTFLKFLQGKIEVDQGTIAKSPSLKISYLQQEVPPEMEGNVADIVAQGLAAHDAEDWQRQHLVDKVLSKADLDGEMSFNRLSGGLKRRVLLAKALVNEPDLLLLDEPTNHLDVTAILWLEKFLLKFHKSFILITHDRALMQTVSTRIIEIDNAQLISWQGHYHDYLKHKEQSITAEKRAHALFDKKLAQEEDWIRQGIKARRTRNEGRVRALKKMREQQTNRRARLGKVKLVQQDLSLSGKIVFDVDNISFRHQDKEIIKNFSTVIARGDKIGIIGPNGSGKSTLLNLLLEKLQPQMGNVKLGTQLQVAYYDQHRQQLIEDKSIVDNVAEGSDSISIGGKSKHIISYLQDFLFSPQRARCPVKSLSGGERNRVLLAKIFTKPCNVLVLDEPTNDLDIETMELLEEQLLNYSGTLLLVSHDREFLNNVVTSTLVMEGDGKIGEYVGGYDDWLRQRKQENEMVESSQKQKPKTQKLSYKDQRELDRLPEKIDQLEKQQQALQLKLADPDFCQSHVDTVAEYKQQLEKIAAKLQEAYSHWEKLESGDV